MRVALYSLFFPPQVGGAERFAQVLADFLGPGGPPSNRCYPGTARVGPGASGPVSGHPQSELRSLV